MTLTKEQLLKFQKKSFASAEIWTNLSIDSLKAITQINHEKSMKSIEAIGELIPKIMSIKDPKEIVDLMKIEDFNQVVQESLRYQSNVVKVVSDGAHELIKMSDEAIDESRKEFKEYVNETNSKVSPEVKNISTSINTMSDLVITNIDFVRSTAKTSFTSFWSAVHEMYSSNLAVKKTTSKQFPV